MAPRAIPTDTYDPQYFPVLAAIEDRHFWFRARRRAIVAAIEPIVSGLAGGYHVLEIGCGTGSVLEAIEHACDKGRVVGMDIHAEGLRFARSRVGCPLVQADIRRMPFTEQFALIGMFDVLEHLPDDEQMLKDVYRIVRPGGALVLTVPALASLWSYADEASRHQRRYELDDLANRLTAAGFTIEFLTHYMSALGPFMRLTRRLLPLFARFRARGSDAARRLTYTELRVIPVVNWWFRLLLAPEARALRRRRPLQPGPSLLAIARKPLRA
jgi:ubiquinone/menaquinone biosynthesis C-methylase UbiE